MIIGVDGFVFGGDLVILFWVDFGRLYMFLWGRLDNVFVGILSEFLDDFLFLFIDFNGDVGLFDCKVVLFFLIIFLFCKGRFLLCIKDIFWEDLMLMLIIFLGEEIILWIFKFLCMLEMFMLLIFLS